MIVAFAPLHAAALGLAASSVLALLVWLASLRKRDVSIVDVAWGFLVWAPVLTVAMAARPGARALTVLSLTGAWALRLAVHLARRNRGRPEDARYQEIRRRNEPNFRWKSLYLVFGLQALLAWIVAAPMMAATASPAPWGPLDALGIALFAFGLGFEALADAQLARFLASPAQVGRVMKTGLWRYSRHPNYFGECCVWWGAWLIAGSAGAWWTIVSPLLMTVLLLRVSGVALLEKDIGKRRPEYADYVRRTNAFLPWRPR